MSEPPRQHDGPEDLPRPEGDLRIESLLRQLAPTPLERGLLDRLEERRLSLSQFQTGPPPVEPGDPVVRPKPARLALLAVASLGAFAAYVALHLKPLPPEMAEERSSELVAVAEAGASEASSPPVSPEVLAPPAGFLPVSRQGYLVGSSHDGVVETGEGTRERLQVEFQDAYHWRDPETGTNLRLYTPRSETVEVPLRTD